MTTMKKLTAFLLAVATMACMVVPAVASTGSIYSREIKENQISTLKDIANREKFFLAL